VTDGWVVVVTPTARREVRRLDPQIKRCVLVALDDLIADPRGGKLRASSLGTTSFVCASGTGA
jgi:hypothetical protein